MIFYPYDDSLPLARSKKISEYLLSASLSQSNLHFIKLIMNYEN